MRESRRIGSRTYVSYTKTSLTNALNKAFPRLLKKLQSALFGDGGNHSENLVSGFRKCGIASFSPKAALERLPDCDL